MPYACAQSVMPAPSESVSQYCVWTCTEVLVCLSMMLAACAARSDTWRGMSVFEAWATPVI